MEVSEENRMHKILSSIFYYLFVVLILGFLGLSFLIDELGLFYDILFVALILSSLVITFYFAIQMLRYNIKVNKKMQMGIFLIVIGFLLILTSLSKSITFTTESLSVILEYDYFMYWGIGTVLLGFFIELTLFDQLIWDNLVVKPAKIVYKAIKSFLLLIRKHWKNIILYTLDLAAVGGIIFILIIWEIIWWKLTIFSVCVLYPIIHHHKIIWRAIRFVAVDVFYKFFHKIYTLIKKFFSNLWQFIKNNYVRILSELGRLILAGGGGYLIYYGIVDVSFRYFIYIGTGIIILFEIILRKTVLRKLYELLKAIGRYFKSLGLFFWNLLKLLYQPFKYIGLKICEFFRFLIRHWLKVILYTFDLIAIGSIVTTIYFTFSLQFYWWYIVILSASGAYLITHHARSIWKLVKFIAVDIFYGIIREIYILHNRIFTAIGRLIKKHWKIVAKEIVRIIIVVGGILLIIFGDELEPAVIGTVMVWSGIVIIPISAIFSRIVVLKFIWKSIKRFFLNLKNAIVGIYNRAINVFKEIGMFIRKYSVWMLRILGLAIVIYGIVLSFSIGWETLLTILIVSIGGFFIIFADFIIHPRKFWRFIKAIPKTIKRIIDTIWLTLKYSTTYIVTNFLRILLLITMLFAMIYGITLITSFNFLPIFLDDPYITRLSVGGGLVIVAVGAFILLRRELKKLRTGESRNWYNEVRARWKN